MGRQLYFFMSKEDELKFLKYIIQKNYIVFSRYNLLLKEEEANNSDEVIYSLSFDGANIIKNEYSQINRSDSEVVEFYRCSTKIEKSLVVGRIWMAPTRLIGDNFVEKSSKLKDLYNLLARYIKRNMKISVDKHYYIAENAYNMYRKNECTLREASLMASSVEFTWN